MAEIAEHLLAIGAGLIYGGDLREDGFTELLFELVSKFESASGLEASSIVKNYIAWPVHVSLPKSAIEKLEAYMDGNAHLVFLDQNGNEIILSTRNIQSSNKKPTTDDWERGLSAMRKTMCIASYARVILGGRVDGFKGRMAGIAEEALQSLENGQPLFVLGGFGGCANDVAEAIGILEPKSWSRPDWPGRDHFKQFSSKDLHNGLTEDENRTLARTPHIDQATALILRGVLRLLRNK